jgi:predicted metal-dependent enzyme (double-stranded beta helix superfamily)
MPDLDSISLSRRALLTGCAVATAHVALGGPHKPAHAPRKFDLQRFIEDCRKAAAAPADAQGAIQELLAREVADSDSVLAALGAPAKGGLNTLYRSPQLTILNIVWSPLMQLLPHEHRMWGLVGIYSGREDNIFWRRAGDNLTAVGAKAFSAGVARPLPADVIHSVSNPIEKLTAAIHIYGGDFFNVHRSEWDPETLTERDWNIREAVRNFEQSNARFFGGASRNCEKGTG